MRVDEAFFSRVGHDLRGELATMLAGVHFLLRYERDLGPTAQQMLERVNAAGQRLRGLLDEFGNAGWAAGESKGLTLVRPVDLTAVIAGAVGHVRPFAEPRDVVLEALDLEVANLELRGDAELLGVALVYALEFAVARSKGDRIEVAAVATDGGATITVTDRGGPLPAERITHLTEPFVEKDAASRGHAALLGRDRLGLGLAIAQGILRAHGGDLIAEISPEGDGVRLVARLGAPIAAATAA